MSNISLKSVPVSVRLICLALLCVWSSPSKASVTINFDVGEVTSAGSLVNFGTFLFIAHGNDNIFNSSGWTSGTNFILGDDILMGAFSIVNGAATSAIPSFELASGQGTYGSTKFTGLFLSGLGSSDISYSTAQLLGGRSFVTTGGSAINFGTYRTDSIEGYGQGSSGNMAWIIPSDGAVLSLYAGTNTDLRGDGFYLGADITAALSTTSTFSVIPEPSSMSLLAMGLASVLALRRKTLAKREKSV